MCKAGQALGQLIIPVLCLCCDFATTRHDLFVNPTLQKVTNMLQSHRWKIEYYSDRVEREILALPAGQLARFVRYADLMEAIGPHLGMPHTRAMGDGLFELRITASEGEARIFYCTVVDERIVILHSFRKKTQKTPNREIATARRRKEEVQSR